MANKEPTFYWYDYETFGLDPARDRPVQFAGVRTTLDFQKVGKESNILCRPSTDYLPSPEAIWITRITPQEAVEKGVSEIEFAEQIWHEFNQSNTTVLGYNTSGFDDDVSRFLFWRNFLDPYSYQWKNGCSRWDIFPVVLALWALRPQALTWPTWESLVSPKLSVEEQERRRQKGKAICFKLEYLTQANQIVHEHAHDAMSDVYGTMALAQLISQRATKFWDWAYKNRTKDKVQEALQAGPVLWVNSKFGQTRGFMKIVNIIGFNPGKRNEAFVWDCAEDPTSAEFNLLSLTREDWDARLFPTKEQYEALKAKGVRPLPVYRLSINTSPFVCGDLRVLTEERAKQFGIDKAKAEENATKLSTMLDALQGALSSHAERHPYEGPKEPDYALYSADFPSADDAERMKQVRSADEGAFEEVGEAPLVKFDSPLLNELLIRFRARNWPQTLSAEQQAAWDVHRYQLLMGQLDPKTRTLTQFAKELEALEAYAEALEEQGCLTDEQVDLIGQMRDWGDYIEGELREIEYALAEANSTDD